MASATRDSPARAADAVLTRDDTPRRGRKSALLRAKCVTLWPRGRPLRSRSEVRRVQASRQAILWAITVSSRTPSGSSAELSRAARASATCRLMRSSTSPTTPQSRRDSCSWVMSSQVRSGGAHPVQGPPRRSGRAFVRQREDDGRLGRDQVVAGGLAGASRIAPDPEQVVPQGEGLADLAPVRGQGRADHLRRPRRRRAQLERPLHRVGPRLEPSHLPGVGQIVPAGGAAGQVAPLPVHELDHQQPPDPPQLRRESGDQGVGLGVGEVAEQDGDVVAEPLRPALTAPYAGAGRPRAGGRWPRPGARSTRPSRRRARARRRAAGPARRSPGRHRRGRPRGPGRRRSASRGGPSPAGSACRRCAPGRPAAWAGRRCRGCRRTHPPARAWSTTGDAGPPAPHPAAGRRARGGA